MSAKPRIGLGLVGTGFMGKTHSFGFATAERVFDLPFALDRVAVADVDVGAATAAARAFGFAEGTGDWRALVADPRIDVVDITAPNALHHEMAMAAIAAGKHVYCEKPLAPTVAEAEAMTAAAEAAGIVTQVGFNYLKNPLMTLAREIVESGELGEIRSFRGIHAEDYMIDAGSPWTWRLDPAGGGGAFADLGSHIVATARHLVGPIVSVRAQSHTLIAERPLARGATETRPVEVDDVTFAQIRFANGAVGSLEASWVATGQKMQHDFELYGSKGGLKFTCERFNEIELYLTDDPAGRRGFRKILAGPDHPPYGAFCVAPGHQLGFNDLKAIEIRDLFAGIAQGKALGPDFAEGLAVHRVVDAAYRASREDRAISLA